MYKTKSGPQFLLATALVLLCLTSRLPAQSSSAPRQNARWLEAGTPYIKNFTYADYNAHVQHWSIVQDKRGVMYFGANHGVHEFDGASWRVIAMPNVSIVRSLATDDSDRIYVGAQDEFGYLKPDVRGEMQYVSLVSNVPLQERSFGDVRNVVVTGEEVWFRSNSHIFRLSGHPAPDNDQPQLQVWHSNTKFFGAFAVQDRFYVQQEGAGLMTMAGDSLSLMPGGEKFADVRIYFILPFSTGSKTAMAPGAQTDSMSRTRDEQTLLVATREGLFLFDGKTFQRFYTEADTFIREQRLQHGAWLSDGSLVLATERRGVAIVGRQGRLQRILDKTSGLRDVHVKFVYEDQRQGLWLALNGGVARYEIQQPLTLYQSTPGIENGVVAITRHQGRLYVATGLGIYYLQPAATPGGPPVFKPVTGITAQCTSLLSADEFLFAGAQDGLYRIENKRATLLLQENISCLYRSKRDPTRIYVGLYDGLGRLELANGQAEFIGKYPGIATSISYVAEDDAGSLWLTTRYRGLWRLLNPSRPGPLDQTRQSKGILRYGPGNGLPNGWINLLEVDQRILFGTAEGLRRFDPIGEVFLPDSTFGAAFAGTACSPGEVTVPDPQGRYWTQRHCGARSEIGVLSPAADETYSWQSSRLARTTTFGPVFSIYPEATLAGVVWFAGSEGVVRYDAALEPQDSLDYVTLVRRVTANDTAVVFGGTSTSEDINFKSATPAGLALLPYTRNNLRFEYAAPFYDGMAENRFQYFLQGLDQGWSEWTRDTWKNYTNLGEGDYSFRVRAKNIYGHVSKEGVFEFTILPPWYRTWWAFLIYTVMSGLFFYGIVRSGRSGMQRRHQRELEHVEYRKLQELDRLKSDFFANISHEFRTPLTLILGPTEDLISEAAGERARRKATLVQRNAQRLLRLINQLLDLAKLETGKTSLQANPGDFIRFMRGLVMSFESWAKRKQIKLVFEHSAFLPAASDDQSSQQAYFDPDVVEKILTNLLSNALKFTPDGEHITVKCRSIVDCRHDTVKAAGECVFRSTQCEANVRQLRAGRRQGACDNNCVEITIEDTGIGIRTERLPYIFDRFYQGDSASTREHEGTGIGLALVKELVELHNGSIEVQSLEGHGTIFSVCLPLGKGHLQQDEIAAPKVGANGDPHLHVSQLESSTEPVADPAAITLSPASEEDELGLDDTIILIIEDNADMRAYIRGHLEPGYKVVEAKDGAEGIARATETIPDLIISDVMMPGKNGYEVCAVLKQDERTSHIPVILLTAKATAEEKLTGLETGADAYVLKPFRAKELLVQVKNLIELRRNLRDRFTGAGMLASGEAAATTVDRQFIRRLQEIVTTDLEDEDFGVETLTQEIGMSQPQLWRKLSALTGQSPSQFIRSVRLEYAKQLLQENSGNVSEIAFAAGFKNLSYFSRCFREKFGNPPSFYLGKK